MAAKTKKGSNAPYFVALGLLGIYNAALVVFALREHDGINLLLYSLVPDMFSIYLGLHGFHQNQFNERHVEHHLRQIGSDMSDVKTYIQVIAGIQDEELEESTL